jgi:hypothetical protein
MAEVVEQLFYICPRAPQDLNPPLYSGDILLHRSLTVGSEAVDESRA